MRCLDPKWDKWIDDNVEGFTIRLTREGATQSEYAVPVDKLERFLSGVNEDITRRERVAKSWRNTAEKLQSENMDLRAQIATLSLVP